MLLLSGLFCYSGRSDRSRSPIRVDNVGRRRDVQHADGKGDNNMNMMNQMMMPGVYGQGMMFFLYSLGYDDDPRIQWKHLNARKISAQPVQWFWPAEVTYIYLSIYTSKLSYF